MLKDFCKYTIDNQSENDISASIEINKKHTIFNGHFPDFPIVPGVCQVLMVKEILNKSLNKNLLLKSARSIKFLGMLNPNEINTIQATVKIKSEDNIYKVIATLFSGKQNYLKFKGEYIGK